MSNHSTNSISFKTSNRNAMKNTYSRISDLQTSGGSKKRKHKRTSTMSTGDLFLARDKTSFKNRVQNQKFLDMLKQKNIPREIVSTIPNYPPSQERRHKSKRHSVRNSSDERNFGGWASNRAHLIQGQCNFYSQMNGL